MTANNLLESYMVRFHGALAGMSPDEQQDIYKRVFINLPRVNGDDTWELPIPATYILDRDRTVLYANANPDYTDRPEPLDILATLEKL